MNNVHNVDCRIPLISVCGTFENLLFHGASNLSKILSLVRCSRLDPHTNNNDDDVDENLCCCYGQLVDEILLP